VNIKKNPQTKSLLFQKKLKIPHFSLHTQLELFIACVRVRVRVRVCVCGAASFFKFTFSLFLKPNTAPDMRLRLNGSCSSSQFVLKLLCFKNLRLRLWLRQITLKNLTVVRLSPL
jgi:hypothetical protein